VRLMHLRKLVPLAELLDGGARPMAGPARPAAPAAAARPSIPPARPAAPARAAAASPPQPRAAAPAPAAPPAAVAVPSAPAAGGSGSDAGARDRYLAAIKAGKQFFFNAVVAQAYRIDIAPPRITFAFLPNQKVPRAQCEENRDWLTALAAQTFGQELTVHVTTVTPGEPGAPAPAPAATAAAAPVRTPVVTGASDDELRQEALADPGVQALFEIFPVERTKIEEM
jgi:hypothetical protein